MSDLELSDGTPGETARPLRYRGLRFPRDPVVLPREVARQLERSEWQAGYTAAAFGLATTSDRALVLGAGTGHLVAILAGKLGVRHVWLAEPDAARRTYVAQVAHANGLARIGFVDPSVISDLQPTLVFVDLTAATIPAEIPTTLRAIALHLPAEPRPDTVPFAALTAQGLAYCPALSAGRALVFRRDTRVP